MQTAQIEIRKTNQQQKDKEEKAPHPAQPADPAYVPKPAIGIDPSRGKAPA